MLIRLLLLLIGVSYLKMKDEESCMNMLYVTPVTGAFIRAALSVALAATPMFPPSTPIRGFVDGALPLQDR
jgi:hypothetical protein